MKKIAFIVCVLVLTSAHVFGQGKLLAIGGGSEKDTENSWNHAAYTRAIDESSNKRVAIISFSTETSWLPDYFLNDCGADFAKNFLINNGTIADAQATYDSLITYDVIFFKGGDQYNYYNIYKDTKTELAVEYVFNHAGVICGTSAGLAILSGVLFTAQNGSAYPDDCIKNPENSDVKLANDFFSFFPGYIFDSHFTIRGRFARLLAFMANWKFNHNEMILGIGVDEMSAIFIDENNIGTVYGIGGANIYEAYSENTFSQNNTKLLADSVKVTQLLQGCTINFNSGVITGLTNSRVPEIGQEKGNYTIFASGSDELNLNTGLLNDFIDITSSSDKILILTDSDLSVGSNYKDKLINLGATDVDIYRLSLDVAESSALLDKIQKADKILFVNNTYYNLISFMSAGSTGQYLNSKILSNGVITAFIGDNSRFIGHTVVEKYLDSDAAYYGNLTFNKGLDLLKTTVIIPKTYINSDYYENTAAAVPYAIVKDTLTYGIWLNKDNYFKYAPTSEEKTYIYPKGTSPVMVLKNEGTNTGFSVQSAYDFEGAPNFSGFEDMTLSLIDESTPYKLGDEVEITTSVSSVIDESVKVYVNYSQNHLEVDWANNNYELILYHISGRKLMDRKVTEKESISLNDIDKGIYIVNLISEQNKYSKKIYVK